MRYNKKNTLISWEKLRQGKHSSEQGAEPLKGIWEGSAAYGEDFQPDVEAGLRRLKGRIQAEKDEGRVVQMPTRFGWLRRAAAVAIVAVAAITLYTTLSKDNAVASDWTTVTTAANEVRDVILPDGSVVTLNEETRLAYNTDLNTAAERTIELEGEAFFDVKRRPDQAFVISTQRAEVKVLGTSFNVRALVGTARTEVEVSTGKVAVRGLEEGEQELLLEATDAVVIDTEYKTYLNNDSPLNSAAWRTGVLSFRASDLATILPLIEQTYQVDLRWNAEQITNCTITATDWTASSFTEVMMILETMTGIKIKELGGKAYQLIGSC